MPYFSPARNGLGINPSAAHRPISVIRCRRVSGRRARQIQCNRIILYAGRVPEELAPSDFSHLSDQTPIEFFAGDSDDYLPEAYRPMLEDQLYRLFQRRLSLRYYKGGHELKAELLE